MSATVARQRGRVQLEQSDMRLALNMANMAKEVLSRAAMEETHQVFKKPRAEVREEKKRGVVFPAHNEVKAAIERHPALVPQNQNGRLPSLPKWHSKETTESLEAQRHGCTSTTTGTTKARNATCATWWLWVSSELQNRRCATRIWVYTYSAALRSIVQSWSICEGSHAR